MEPKLRYQCRIAYITTGTPREDHQVMTSVDCLCFVVATVVYSDLVQVLLAALRFAYKTEF